MFLWIHVENRPVLNKLKFTFQASTLWLVIYGVLCFTDNNLESDFWGSIIVKLTKENLRMTILGSKLVIAKSFVLQKLLYVAMVCQNIFKFL